MYIQMILPTVLFFIVLNELNSNFFSKKDKDFTTQMLRKNDSTTQMMYKRRPLSKQIKKNPENSCTL